jgi:hypothetical protein
MLGEHMGQTSTATLDPLFDDEPEYFRWIANLRKAKHLHTTVEDRLVALVSQALPEYLPVKEPQGLAGGRNDLLLFDFRGRKALFEIFASQSQVSRDLRILDKTHAAVKISVVIDREVDAKVWDRIQKENPETNYPYLFIKELFLKQYLGESRLKLRQLIAGDEEAHFLRLYLERVDLSRFVELWGKEGLRILSKKDIETKTVSFQKVFNLYVIQRLQKLGMQPSKLKKLVEWLSNEEMAEFVFRKLGVGFNLLLFTDLDEHMDVMSDIELLDWIQGFYVIDDPIILLSVNNIVVELLTKCFPGLASGDYGKKILFTIGHSHITDESAGRGVSLSLPRNTKRISIFRPWASPGFSRIEQLTKDEVLQMIELF